MKKSKAIPVLLILSLLASLVIPGTLALPTRAAVEQEDSGMVINKTATANGDGTYTIQLEAYATGDKVITETKKDVPTDIVLVLDQSGSMKENMDTYSFREYTNKDNSGFYNLRHNGGKNPNLYYRLDDGSYASVSVTRTQGEGAYIYTECPATWNNSSILGGTDNYYANRNNLYVKSGEEYQKVTLVGSGKLDSRVYTYTFPDNTTFVSNGIRTSPGNFGGKGPLYVLSIGEGEYTYEYTYTDKEGVTQAIGTSTGANTVPDLNLYERYASSSTTRLAALKTAVTNFSNSVATKAAGEDGRLGTEDDVNHRIAVVGFASGERYNSQNYNYGNTEVFIGSNQYKYKTDAQNVYGSAFQSMNTTQGKSNVTASINALDADGGTIINLGMEMANGILGANPVPEGEKRNRVVIVFTDGTPGWSGYDSKVAQAAITQGETAKKNGVTVYTVGIFSGADASTAGDGNGSDTEKANWFMQNLSSNNGTPQNPSYYLSAADADTLNSIFQQISDQIESGGSSTTLNSETVIKDMISPQFTLQEGATAENITLETYSYTGENQWEKNADAMGATATVNGDQVNVTGFDFAENYVGTVTENGNTTYRGDKLIISFEVVPKAGFLGGNGVYTNANAGVYENSSAKDPVLEFERPDVDIAIKDVTVIAQDQDVYLLQDVPVASLRNGAAARVGDVPLDLTKPAENWGLEPWQNEYVNITVEVKDKDGNVMANDLTGLTADSPYTVSVKITPKNEGTATGKTGGDTGNINVYKPELTFKDSEVYYGDTVPAGFSGNLTATRWLHGDTEADTAKMGTAPTLTIDYTPDADQITDGRVNTKQDVAVDVSVKIGETSIDTFTGFQHTNCTGKDCSVPEGREFLLHVNTCQLTVTKTGGASGEPYVFNIYKDGAKYSEVTVVGNTSETIYELPVGTYTIQEDTGWSWRYTAADAAGVSLTAESSTGKISCTNTENNSYWLNGFSEVVKNIFENQN